MNVCEWRGQVNLAIGFERGCPTRGDREVESSCHEFRDQRWHVCKTKCTSK